MCINDNDFAVFSKSIKMKTIKLELNVDFIGGQTSLTIAEEKALSEFFSQQKSGTLKPKNRKLTKVSKREKAFA